MKSIDSQVRLVIKQKVGQPQGNLENDIWTEFGWKRPRDVAALMRYRGKNGGVEPPYGSESAISEAITWASKGPAIAG